MICALPDEEQLEVVKLYFDDIKLVGNDLWFVKQIGINNYNYNYIANNIYIMEDYISARITYKTAIENITS